MWYFLIRVLNAKRPLTLPLFFTRTSLARTVLFKVSKTSFEKNCFSAWASTLDMGLMNKVDMVCLSPVGYGV